MEPNKRLFIAFSITMILVVAFFTSVGRSLLALSTPSIELPTLTTSSGELSEQTEHGSLYRIDITTRTVQSVIAALQTQESYTRRLQTRLFWGEDFAETEVQVWYHQGISHVEKNLTSGLVRHDMILDSTLLPVDSPVHSLFDTVQEEPQDTQVTKIFYWYDKEQSYLTQKNQLYSADLAQSIPTYQTILDLGIESIQQANYQIKQDISCVFIEATPPPLFFTERYWVSTETGLLIAAETYEGDKLIYQMEEVSDSFSPLPENYSFSLPDGTVLCEVS